MGIINTTPDSFYKGSRHTAIDDVLKQAEKMISEGADLLDIGGYSTRPGADDISIDEELKRVIPVIESLSKYFPDTFLSVDTFRSAVAKKAVQAGAHFVNDVSAGDDDPLMFETIATLNVPYIIMHKKGTPKTMQLDPHYENVVLEIMDYFAHKVGTLKKLNIHDIIIDPGFCFGKTLQHNYQLLSALNDFQIFGLPTLIGVSRKSMVQKLLNVSSEHALNGTTALHIIALQKGAKILRVHDVKEAVECVKIVKALNGSI